MVIPYMPMLLPPVNWSGYVSKLIVVVIITFLDSFCRFFGSYNRGGYLFLPSYIMRTHGAKQQRDVVKRTPKKQLEPVFGVGEFESFHLSFCIYFCFPVFLIFFFCFRHLIHSVLQNGG